MRVSTDKPTSDKSAVELPVCRRALLFGLERFRANNFPVASLLSPFSSSTASTGSRVKPQSPSCSFFCCEFVLLNLQRLDKGFSQLAG